ncbi:MAG: DUF6662 family protein [Ignavibacteriota bacterium]
MKLLVLQLLLFIGTLIVLDNPALANRRHFTYVYESAVLPKASHEVEIWNTLRIQRKNFFRGIDSRLEFEFGLGDNFQTSLYLNSSSEAAFSDGSIQTDESLGFSNEWKYKVLDAFADPVGLALYAEGGFSVTETELEGKVILDKQFDGLLLAFNATAEHSFVSGLNSDQNEVTEAENVIEFSGGIAYHLSQSFTVGLEARHHTKKPPVFEGGGSYSALFAGPTLSFAGPNWWAALSVISQLSGSTVSSSPTASTEKLELTEHEKLETRLLLSFEF